VTENNFTDEFLIDYLEQRDADRTAASAAFFASLTDRERALVKDAAVMGYVQGKMHPQGEKHPKDSWVLSTVVTACLAFPDLYPAINFEADARCPGFEGNPVAPDLCAGCHEPRENHEVTQ